MNFLATPLVSAALIFVLTRPLSANDIPSDRISLTEGANETWNADWSGLYVRSYFFQWSWDLETWSYAPFIDFSDGLHRRGFESTTARFFIRHHHTDLPTSDPGLEDFDGDGLGSLIEVKVLDTDPLDSDGWTDADGDGIHDALELHWFGNLTATNGSGDANANGIRDDFELQAALDPLTDSSGDAKGRSNYTYDAMGRLITADEVAFDFDSEGNLEAAIPTVP
jgi:hypothetical protein